MEKRMPQPPWTYSRLDKFETCPRQFYHLKVVKDYDEPPTIHTEWGKTVHTAFENAVLHGEPLPEGMTQWEKLAHNIKAMPGLKLPEHQMSLTSSFLPCEWDDAWTRGIADLLVVSGKKAAVLDYKTGKVKPSEQLELYAAYTFAHFPQVEEVQTAFVWLKHKRITRETVTRAEVPVVWQKFMPRVNKLVSAYERNSWPPHPSGLCNGWCPIKACEYYKEKR